jgi:hypothetical protein
VRVVASQRAFESKKLFARSIVEKVPVTRVYSTPNANGPKQPGCTTTCMRACPLYSTPGWIGVTHARTSISYSRPTTHYTPVVGSSCHEWENWMDDPIDRAPRTWCGWSPPPPRVESSS